MRVTMLGCGGSGGVPLANGHWGACDPDEPKNWRRRPSILVEVDGIAILVDTGPDLRMQLIDSGCSRLDAVLYTHGHADHVHGVDDLRALNHAMGRAIDCYGSRETLDGIAARFGYVFRPVKAGAGFYRPQLTPHCVERPFRIGQTEIRPFAQDHTVCVSTGFRIGRFAYSTDVASLDEAAFATLAGVEVWIVGCLREAPHPSHAHLARVRRWVDRLGPTRTILTHMNHTMDYATIRARLPPNIEPGYDGLVVDVAS